MTEQAHAYPSGESTEDKHVRDVSHGVLPHCKRCQHTVMMSLAREWNRQCLTVVVILLIHPQQGGTECTQQCSLGSSLCFFPAQTTAKPGPGLPWCSQWVQEFEPCSVLLHLAGSWALQWRRDAGGKGDFRAGGWRCFLLKLKVVWITLFLAENRPIWPWTVSLHSHIVRGNESLGPLGRSFGQLLRLGALCSCI